MKAARPAPLRPPTQIDAIEDLVATILLGITGVCAGISVVVLAGAELAAALFGGGAS